MANVVRNERLNLKNSNFPTLKIIELCLTYRCNVKCHNCSNLCTQAPSTESLEPEDIYFFLDDLVEHNHKLDLITLHGGEPILTPYFEDIVKLLCEYRKGTGCELWLLSNNSTELIRTKTKYIREKYGIALGISEKQQTNRDANGNQIMYVPVNESPDDLGLPYTLGCFQSSQCGICYNKQGYFPCSPMAAASRVFDYSSMGHSILDVTEEACNEKFAQHCKHCGFAMPDRRRVFDQVNTPTWEKAFADYRERLKNEVL